MNIENITLLRIENKLTGVYSTFSHPGLALPIIGTVLKNAGYKINIFIDSIEPPSREILKKSDVVCFSVNSSCFIQTYEKAKQLRKDSQCKIIFGGPHVTFMPDEALQYCDFVIRGEGEHAILELLESLQKDHPDFEHIKGLSWRDNNGHHHNPKSPLVDDINLIPDHSLIVGYHDRLKRFINKIFPMGMLVGTTRGCVHQCSFCIIPKTFGKRIRYRDYDTIIADIKKQVAFSGNRYIYFTDDNFAINPEFTKVLLKRIIDEKLDIRFSAQVRCEITMNGELMELMKASGAYLVFVGFESINNESLKLYNKGGKQSKSQIERSIVEFHKHGINVHGMFVVGADTDKPGDAISTAKWALEHDLDSIQLLPICPLPGTEIIKQFENENRILKSYNSDTNELYINYGVGNSVLYMPKQMSAVELQKEILAAYKIFYNSKNILKNIIRIHKNGIEPAVYKIMGSSLVKKAEPDIKKQIAWLESMDLSTIESDHV